MISWDVKWTDKSYVTSNRPPHNTGEHVTYSPGDAKYHLCQNLLTQEMSIRKFLTPKSPEDQSL